MMHSPVYTQSSSEESTSGLLIPLFETHWKVLQLKLGSLQLQDSFPVQCSYLTEGCLRFGSILIMSV